MNDRIPHYLLMSEASRAKQLGRWRFVLRPADGSGCIEVADVEPNVWGQRLDLLTVVRALESLDQPSRVTLIGCGRYVEQGILYGLPEWKLNGWRWEWFGQMAPVRDTDLWQRIDRALQFHRVNCQRRRCDAGHGVLAGPHWNLAKRGNSWAGGIVGVKWVKYHVLPLLAWRGLLVRMATSLWQRGLGFRVQGSGFGT